MKAALKLSPVDTKARKALTFKAGDTIRVWSKIEEGKDKQGNAKFRLQAFEGMVLARKHGAEMGATYTVRKVSNGVGVERIFPLYSPMVEKIEMVKEAQARRSKLYYVREKAVKDVRKKMKSQVVRKTRDGVSTFETAVEETPETE